VETIPEELNITRISKSTLLTRFLQPLQDCEFGLNSILDDLQVDPWVVPQDERPHRATGAALNIAISLMETAKL